ncbi:MAG: hypothetical protein JNL90_13805 [Planctomycetes bacterium]|nr:hypothetical protein [Planctomycetota bacterium]
MPDAATLLARAACCYDEPRFGLAAAARIAARGGFAGGAEWMRRALGAIRGESPHGAARFTRLGVVKYALASGAALLLPALALPLLALPAFASVVQTPLAAALRWLLLLMSLPLASGAFYAVESRFVFAFPCAIDGDAVPLRASHRLLARTAAPLAAIRAVVRIAASMVVGGLLGRGFLRSWAIGCLAVLLWYEEARAAARAAASAAVARSAGVAA